MRSYVQTICALAIGILFAANVSAQQLRIAYVDMKQVLDNAPQVLAGRATLDKEFRPRNDAIEMDEFRAGTLEARLLQADQSPDNKTALERELRELHRNIRRRQEDLRDELSFRRTEEVQRLEEEINVAVQEIALRNGYDLIISSPVVYASPDLDITDLILEQLVGGKFDFQLFKNKVGDIQIGAGIDHRAGDDQVETISQSNFLDGYVDFFFQSLDFFGAAERQLVTQIFLASAYITA